MKKAFLVAILLIMTVMLSAHAATNNDYCSMPLFMTNAVKPNIMVVVDFSGSMQFPAYVPCDWDNGGYVGVCAYCESSTSALAWATGTSYTTGTLVSYGGNYYQCRSNHTSGTFAADLAANRWLQIPSDGHYDGTATSFNTRYYGYFNSDANYAYDSTGGYWYESACTVSSSNATRATACVPGNILNWVATSRIDVARKMLTGGRISTSGTTVTLDSEGGYFKYQDRNLQCEFSLTEIDTNNPTSRQLHISNYSGTCAIGTIPSTTKTNVNVLYSTSGATPTGILDNFSGKVNFESMIYNSTSGNEGLIKSIKGDPLTTLKNGINTQRPYNGTPTGSALWEAYDFYKQSNDHTTVSNSGAINKGNTSYDRDPWWDGVSSAATAIPCRKSFVFLISDGAFNYSDDPVIPAYKMHTMDLRPDDTEPALSGLQNVDLYAIYAFGDLDPDVKAQGRQSMITAALFGGFSFDTSASNPMPYPFTGYTAGGSSSQCHTGQNDRSSSLVIDGGTTYCNSRDVVYPISGCNPSGTMNGGCSSWDEDGNGLPDNYFEADDPANLEARITEALNAMVRRASSGTAASVLASSEGSGANLLQAVFYPKRLFDNTEIEWISEIQNLWFYIDPWFRGATNIREDSIVNDALDMTGDNVIEFAFNTATSKTELKRYIPNSDGSKGTETTPSPDDIDNAYAIWKAGEMLFERNISTSPRNIYTTITGVSPLMEFSVANASFLQTYLQASSVTEAENIIKYIQGIDISGYRNRTITRNSITNTWKLGDIISSTPRLKASFALNTYDMYPPDGYRDTTYSDYVNDPSYKERGMVYVGANDGMLHAFELGKLTYSGLSTGQIAKLTTTDEPIGTERWAYIPKGALPYLKYLTQTNYCHMFYVDNPVTIADVSMYAGTSIQVPNYTKSKDSWRTILIGSMGIGGACRNSTATCSTTTDCVKTPIPNVGYSAYFALDITDPIHPTLLWEFSRDDMGFATTGPAIVRLGSPTKNGKWYAVFASGPTGPINTTYHQFMGNSDQNLKIFVLDLLQGPAASVQVFDTGLTKAFGGSLLSATLDVDRNNQSIGTPYQDDVIYVGYTKKDTTAGTWTKGGVIRILTNHDLDPANWTVSRFIDNIGPVTSAVTKLIDTRPGKKNLWVYFGTGRYYYRLDNGITIDDPTNQRKLYGIKEPCYNGYGMTVNCTTTVLEGDLSVPSSNIPTTGWYINLDPAGSGYKAERVITDPLAIPSGIVFFTTVAPSSDVCSFGGKTSLWFPWFETGGLPPASALARLEAMLQVSTGAIVSTKFTTGSGYSNPKVTVAQGIPSKDQGLSVFMPPPPLRRVLHMKEK